MVARHRERDRRQILRGIEAYAIELPRNRPSRPRGPCASALTFVWYMVPDVDKEVLWRIEKWSCSTRSTVR